MEIRRVKREDVADIAALSNQLGYPASAAEIGEQFDSILRSRDHGVFVASRVGGPVIGYIHVRICRSIQSGSFAEISGFVVSEAFRRKGIGKQLLKAVEEWTREKDIPRLRVRTQVHRADAKGFYAGHGFSIAKQQVVFDKLMDKKH